MVLDIVHLNHYICTTVRPDAFDSFDDLVFNFNLKDFEQI